MTLSEKLHGNYHGVIASSETKAIEDVQVSVTQLSERLVKVSFEYEGIEVSFRALLTQKSEGVLMIIREVTTYQYILNGVNGFLYRRGNVHGGLLKNLGSLYFHIRFDSFDGQKREIYFLGKQQHSTEEMLMAEDQVFQQK